MGSFTWDSLEQERSFQQLSSSESLQRADKDRGPEASPAPPAHLLSVTPPQRGSLSPSPTHCRRQQASAFVAFFQPAPYLCSCGWAAPSPLEVLLKSLPQTREPTCQIDLLPQAAGTFIQDSTPDPRHHLWTPVALWRNTGRTLVLGAVLRESLSDWGGRWTLLTPNVG